MLNIVLFGPPGSGKGTQAEKIVAKYNLAHLSTGDILREEIKNETAVGLKCKEYISKGELVPDSLVAEQLALRTVKHMDGNGVIFDGFPRTIPQADMLDDILGKSGLGVDVVVAIMVPDEELMTRLVKRGEISGRADDNAETIKNRLDVYKSQTLPLLDHYKAQGKLVTIEGVGAIDEIFGKIAAALDAKL